MMFSPRDFSLRAKLVMASVVVEVFMLTILVATNLHVMENQLKDQAQLRLAEVSALLNASLGAPLAERDYGAMDEVLKEVRREQGVPYLVLLDRVGKPIASSGWPMGKPLPPLSTGDMFSHDNETERFNTAIPITVAGQSYGRLHFGISTHFLVEARKTLLLDSLIIASLEVSFSFALLAGLGFWLTRHLATLTQASESVAAGNFNVNLPVKANDEVGLLTAAFNTMARAIRLRIEALQQAEEKQREYLADARQEHDRFSALLSTMNHGILFVSADDRVLYFNPAFLRIWMIPDNVDLAGRPAEDVMKRFARLLMRPDAFATSLMQAAASREANESFDLQLTDGRTVTQLVCPVHDRDHHFIGRMWVYEDITQDRQTAEQLIYLAERDPLTGLSNRHHFRVELERMIAGAEHSTTESGALLVFDVDEFKGINDTFGHRVGDAILIRIAREVETLIRRNAIFSRLGGDEFALLGFGMNEAEASELADQVVRAVARIPFNFDGQNVRLTASVGVALYPQHAATAEELVAHGDTAMYQAKESGKNTWRIYRADREASRAMVARLSWNDRISRALENNLLQLHFQGVYQTASTTLAHVEALVRMIDEDKPDQLIMPAHFIHFAEKNGRIQEIDRWVIRESIALLGRSPSVPPVAVNISGRSFDDPSLPRYISEQLAHYGVTPDRLLVELTETSAVTDLHDAQRFIESLHQTGCKVCLDDFGTGFASFAYLKHLNADVLKIDGLFIRDLPRDTDNQVFVKAIVDVARGMGKVTIAEFVENAEILVMLQDFGVDYVQGYHLDKPRSNHPAVYAPLAAG